MNVHLSPLRFRACLKRGTIRLYSRAHPSINQLLSLRRYLIVVLLLATTVACSDTPTESHSQHGTVLVAMCVPAGANVSCTATFQNDSQPRDVTSSAMWLVSDPTIGSFTTPGVFVPTKTGKVALWARCDSVESLKSSFLVAPAVSPARLYVLSGVVKDDATATPIVGATVQIVSGFAQGEQATTNDNGAYFIDGILTGEVFSVGASKPGYVSSTKSYRVDSPVGPGGGNPPFLDFLLQSQP
jgi:hypothetical protein